MSDIKAGVSDASSRYLLFQDNLDAQCKSRNPEYINYLKTECQTDDHKVPPNKTDQVQPIDRGIGAFVVVVVFALFEMTTRVPSLWLRAATVGEKRMVPSLNSHNASPKRALMSCLLLMPSAEGMLAGGVAGTSFAASTAMAPSADEMLRAEDMKNSDERSA